MTSNVNLFDTPVTDIDAPLSLPKKYIKEKKKRTHTDNIRKKMRKY